MKKVLVSILALVCFVSTAAHGVEMRLGVIHEPSNPWTVGLVKAGEMIKERTDGRVIITVYPSSVLGTENDLLEQVVTGGIELMQAGSGGVANFYPPIHINEMPYVFRDADHAVKYMKSPKSLEMREDFYRENGARIIAQGIFGVRHIIGNKLIHTPDDLKDFRLRVPDQKPAVQYAIYMGANPTPIAISEAYMALQQNVCDGMENPLTPIMNMKVQEVSRNLSLTAHVINIGNVIMNGDALDALSPEDQKIVLDSFQEACDWITDTIAESDRELLEIFRNQGVTIIEPDREAFKEKTKGMAEEYAHTWAKFGDLYQYIKDL